jgi:hypothetical protein
MLATAAMGGGGNRYAGLTSHSLAYLMEVESRIRPSGGLHTQVPQRLNDLFFPTRKPLKIPLHMLSLSETLLLQVINTTRLLLNHTNPTLAHGCWMCQQARPSQVISSPINISTLFTLSCSFTKRPTASTLSPVSFSLPAEFLRDS